MSARERQQQQGSSVAQARARLAPTRAMIGTGKKDFQRRKPKLAEIFGTAEVRRQQALSVGVSHFRLTQILQEVYGHGGGARDPGQHRTGL